MSYPTIDLHLLEREAARLHQTAERLDESALAEPSGCGGWSRGHVLSHLARHAEALAGVLAEVEQFPAAAFVPGELTKGLRPVYQDDTARDRGIEAHAHDSAVELLAALAATTSELHRRLHDLPADLTESRVERTPGGTSVPLGQLPFQRLREVVVHHVDLQSEFTFDDLEDETSRLLLADTLQRIAAAEPGLAPRLARDDSQGSDDNQGSEVEIGGARVHGTRAQLLSWLLRQQSTGLGVEGVLPAVPAV
jgi:maleylpyruvate isomerase